jgi:hypothetical protein
MLLGAGASAASDFRLPTMARFFVDEPMPGTRGKAFLDWYYPEQEPCDYNLEDILAFLDTGRTRTELWEPLRRPTRPELDFAWIYGEVIAFMKARLDKVSNDQWCTQHRRLFSELQQFDSVLTLNYDLIADRTLGQVEVIHEPVFPDGVQARPDLRRLFNRPDMGRLEKMHRLIGRRLRLSSAASGLLADSAPGLTAEERGRGFYLKLHGSLDWVGCPTAGCENNVNWFVEDVRSDDGQQAGVACRHCGANLETMIVPPVATKRLQDRGRLAAVWRTALDELSQCDHLVIFGVSFAPSDIELRWLLRQAVAVSPRRTDKLTISVINTSERAFKAVRAMFDAQSADVSLYPDLEAYLARDRSTTHNPHA